MLDGSQRVVHLADNFKEVHKDEYTSEPLPAQWVHAAMHDEVDYFNSNVWTICHIEVAQADPEAKVIGTRFITSNKGDIHEPDVRVRLVAQEVGDGTDAAYYAATPLSNQRGCCSLNSHLRERGVGAISNFPLLM